MKKLLPVLFIFSLSPLTTMSQSTETKWLKDWLNAWEMIHGQLLQLPASQPPEMVFYDDTFVYTTSAVTAPAASRIKGPGMYGKPLPWQKARHNDTLTLPDGQRVPVGLMSFAASTPEGKSFFVMAAPSFWEAAGVASSEFTLNKMLTGVFLHEFTHTRQQKGFGRQVDSIERAHAFADVPLTDDIVQGYFKADSEYVRQFREETDAFYTAAFATDRQQAEDAVRKGISLLKTRQAKYFTGNKNILEKLDGIFLSMEGLGQYIAVYWLLQPNGGNTSRDAAISGFRRKRNQWSQEEGLAMFLALARLKEHDWVKDQFSERPQTIVELLEQAVR